MGATVFYLLMPQKYNYIIKHPLCLGNILVDFSAKNMIKTGLSGFEYNFSVDYNIIDSSNIINIQKYLKKKNDTI